MVAQEPKNLVQNNVLKKHNQYKKRFNMSIPKMLFFLVSFGKFYMPSDVEVFDFGLECMKSLS